MKITSIIWFLGRPYNGNMKDLFGSARLKPLRDFIIIVQRKENSVYFDLFQKGGKKCVYVELFRSPSLLICRNFVSNFFNNKGFVWIHCFWVCFWKTVFHIPNATVMCISKTTSKTPYPNNISKTTPNTYLICLFQFVYFNYV